MDKLKIFSQPINNRKPIIFVHGFPYDHRMWIKVINLLQNDFYCITYDIRGLGESPVGDGNYSMDLFAEDMLNVIKDLNLDKPALCGLSMGGYIALRTIEKSESTFSYLILLDTKSEPDNEEGKSKRDTAIKKIDNDGLSAYVKEFIPTCFSKKFKQENEGELNTIIGFAEQHNPVGVKGCITAMKNRTDTTPYLSKIKIPTLVLCGEEDALSPPEKMKEMGDKINGSKFKIISHAGHMTPIENPVAVAEEIKKFI